MRTRRAVYRSAGLTACSTARETWQRSAAGPRSHQFGLVKARIGFDEADHVIGQPH